VWNLEPQKDIRKIESLASLSQSHIAMKTPTGSVASFFNIKVRKPLVPTQVSFRNVKKIESRSACRKKVEL